MFANTPIPRYTAALYTAFRYNGPLQLRHVFDITAKKNFFSMSIYLPTCCQSTLRRTFRQLTRETDGKSSIKTFWKNYIIKDAVDSISESWKELKLTTMNHVWKKIWPECVKSTDAEVNFLPEIRQSILDLAHDLGFEGLNEFYVQMYVLVMYVFLI